MVVAVRRDRELPHLTAVATRAQPHDCDKTVFEGRTSGVAVLRGFRSDDLAQKWRAHGDLDMTFAEFASLTVIQGNFSHQGNFSQIEVLSLN